MSVGSDGQDRAARRRRRGPGIEVRPGAIREARLEAGLSPTELAGTAISRIALYKLETGKTRPKPETLDYVAQRTGKPLDFFLAAPPASAGAPSLAQELNELDELIVLERWEALVERAGPRYKQERSAAVRAEIGVRLARANCHLIRPDEALPIADEAARFFEEHGPQRSWCEALEVLGLAESLLERPEGLLRFESALNVCRGLDPLPKDLESRLLGRIAYAHTVLRNWSEAVRYGQAAVETLENLDLGRLRNYYGNLGIAYGNLGDAANSLRYARKALAISEAASTATWMAMAECNLGCALMRVGQSDEARHHLLLALEVARQAGMEAGAVYILIDLAELEVSTGRLHAANERIDEAERLARARDERLSLSRVYRWRAEIADREGDAPRADREFGHCFETLEGLSGSEEVEAESRVAYARILEKRGEATAALRQMEAVIGLQRPHLVARRQLLLEQLGGA